MAANTRIEELRRRVQVDPASIAFAALAEEYRRIGRYEDAIATCLAGLHRHPAYLSARVTLGRSFLELGRYDEAQEQLEHVLKAAPENLAATRALAEIRERRSTAAAAAGERTSAPRPPLPAETSGARTVPAPERRLEVAPLRVARVPTPRSVPDTTGQRTDAALDQKPAFPPSVELPSPLASAVSALEAFLGAIVRARESLDAGSPRDPDDREVGPRRTW